MSARLNVGDWSDSRLARFAAEERGPSRHGIETWLFSRAGLGAMEKRLVSVLSGIERRFLCRPAHSLVKMPTIYPSSQREERIRLVEGFSFKRK